MIRLIRALPVQVARRDDGLTLVELTVALAILLLSVMILPAHLSSLKLLLVGKQRVSSKTAAQELVEVAKSLTWTTLGLHPQDTTLPSNGGSDPDLTTSGTCSSGYRFKGECIVHSQGVTAAAHPLNPHLQAAFKRGSTTITRSVWVTAIDTNGDGITDLKRITVRASFSAPAAGAVGNTVESSTLVSQSASPGAGEPLTGNSKAARGSFTVTANVGAGSVAESFVYRAAESESESLTASPLEQARCSAQSPRLDRSGGSTLGASTLTALADNNPLNATPEKHDPALQTFAGSPIPSDIDPWLTETSLPGGSDCFGSHRGNTSDDDGLAYATGDAYGPATVRLTANPAGVTDIDSITMLDLADADASARDVVSLADFGPTATTVTATSTVRGVDVRAARLTSSVLGANAPSEGIFRVEPFTTTVTAKSTTVDCQATPGHADCPKLSNAPVSTRLRVYDPSPHQIPGGTCSSYSSDLRYCIIDSTVTAGVTVDVDNLSVALGGSRKLVWSVNLTGSALTTQTTTGATGSSWLAEVAPLSGTVEACVTTATTATCNRVDNDLDGSFDEDPTVDGVDQDADGQDGEDGYERSLYLEVRIDLGRAVAEVARRFGQ